MLNSRSSDGRHSLIDKYEQIFNYAPTMLWIYYRQLTYIISFYAHKNLWKVLLLCPDEKTGENEVMICPGSSACE